MPLTRRRTGVKIRMVPPVTSFFLTEVIERLLAPYEKQLRQAGSMPGWGRRTAEDAVAALKRVRRQIADKTDAILA